MIHKNFLTILNKSVLNNIFKNILICDLSYENPNNICNILEDNQYSIIKPYLKNQIFIDDKETDTQVYIWLNYNEIYISFRGTNSIKDALIDLQIKQTHYKDNIYVHSGFYKQYKAVEQTIFDSIDKNNNIQKINISGHSLGGAIASIASAILSEKYNNIEINCYTFGCPRVGNNNFKKYFKKYVSNYYRIQIQDDPIPMTPMCIWYYHTSKAININNNLEISYISDNKWYYRFIKFLFNLRYTNVFEDHHTKVYIEKIKDIYNKELLDDCIDNKKN